VPGAPAGIAQLPLLRADVTDAASLATIAQSTRAIVTTVGPYVLYGEPVVAACAAAGTHYLDISGEPEFVDRMFVAHHAQAVATGARLIHACGFDSIPHDLGALYTVEQLPEELPLTVEGFVRAGAGASGGTYQSALYAFSHLGDSRRAAAQRRSREPRPQGRLVRGIGGTPHRDAVAGGWVLPLPTIDPQIVLRSARALPRYGPSFQYGHYLAARRVTTAAGIVAGVGAVAVLAQIGPVRSRLEGLRSAGDGPSAEQRARSWFKVRFHGRPTEGAGGGGLSVICEVAGGDPGYTETAKMLSEAALCLLEDDLPDTAGQVTTAQALGRPLIDRLHAAGITFRVVEGQTPTAAG
jgi:short subunit dehydrogenase-like uncharacterized protein